MYFSNEILTDISQTINSIKAFNIYVFLEKQGYTIYMRKKKKSPAYI